MHKSNAYILNKSMDEMSAKDVHSTVNDFFTIKKYLLHIFIKDVVQL